MKNQRYNLARCVFVYTNFSSCTSKNTLAFFVKRGKRLRNSSFVFKNHVEYSKLFFFNLYRFQINPDCLYIAQVASKLLFSEI
jgi:hypothetical protein